MSRAAGPYQINSNRRNLCLEEKKKRNITSKTGKHLNTLNQRTELVSKFRHKAKYKLTNHQPN